jgi:alkylation response protein AidB-like acyl-CoA dehydrogenase
MDLSYGPQYEALRAEVRAFLGSSWPPRGADAALSRREQTLAFRRRAIEAGYLARSIPRRYGGSEQPPDSLAAQVIREEFARAGAPGEARGIGTMMLVPTLLERGAEWQKEKWIPSTVLGETLWCQGYSEPGAGSDLASLKTRAELVGDEWVVHGQKIWTSDAQRADFMFCLCRTEPDAPKHAGISYLLIDMKQPGVEVRPLRQMTGDADFNEVFLTGARTPKDWIVGRRGEGWLVSRTTLKHERNSIGNADLSKSTFDALVELARRTRRGGRPALEDPEVRQRLVRIQGYVEAHLYSSYRQLTDDARGRSSGLLGLMNKLHYTNIGQEIAKLALDLLGDDGMLDPAGYDRQPGEPPRGSEGWLVQTMWSLGVAIAGGTANIQRNVIAERGLGLPRDAAAQRSR